MRMLLPALFLAGGVGGPPGGACGHMGSASHGAGGSIGHGSFSGSHASSSPSVSRASSSRSAAATAHPHLGAAIATGVSHALAAGVRAVEAALGLALAADEPPIAEPAAEGPSCHTADDCGLGQLGNGAVCDHWSQEPRAVGVCREACRDDRDCPPPLECHWNLDPADPNSGGCLE